MSLMSRGMAALQARMKTGAGVALVYARGAQSITLTGWIGRQVYASQLEGGRRLEFGERDYLIGVDDLTFGEPRIGDRVTETINGRAVVFEVATPTNGEPQARYVDQTRTMWRVHVKEVA